MTVFKSSTTTLVAATALAATASAQVVITDNFEVDSSANYTVVTDLTPDSSRVFAYDYVAAGIPLAPRSQPGDVGGLRLSANDSLGAADAQTVFHNTVVNANQYRLKVDVFMRFPTLVASTEHAHVGVGGDGATFNSLFTPISGSGAFIAFTGDGGSGSDYRWFRSPANTPPGDTANTTLPNSHPSYLGRGSNNTGSFFTSLFPSPPATVVGSPGNIWTTVEIYVDNLAGVISFSFDGKLTYLGRFANRFDGRVSLGLADTFASLSGPNIFTVFDNLEVEALSNGQQPTSIFGVNLRVPGFYTTNTAGFVSNLNVIAAGAPAPTLFAMDFDETAQTLYAVRSDTLDIGTLDLTTGVYTSTGVTVTGPLPTAGATGITCTPDGTWYLSQFQGTTVGTVLFVGDIETGVFTQVGVISSALTIDISANERGELFGHETTADNFLSIDTTTGAGTVVAPTGLAANFAQGMDFDWSTGLLYASVYTGGGTGTFVAFDPATNTVTALESTTVTNGEFEMACRVPATMISQDVCGAGAPNSTGAAALLQVAGSSLVTDNKLKLTVHYLPDNSTGYFVNSPDAPFTVVNAGGAVGNLCIASLRQGRHSNNILDSGTTGAVQLMVDLTAIPTPLGAASVLAAEQWSFQYWYRDTSGSGAVSNFSNARRVLFY